MTRPNTAAEKALAEERDARQQLLRAQEVGKFGSWEVDLARNVLVWSDMVFRIFETSRTDFEGSEEAFFAFIHPDDRAMFHAARETWLKEGGSFSLEHRIVTPNGTVKWVIERAELIRNEAGHPIYTVGTAQDITDLVAAQAETAQRDAELSAVMSAIADGFLTLDKDARVRFVSDKGCEYLGRGRGELVGRRLWEAVPEIRGSALQAQYETVRMDGTNLKVSGPFTLSGRTFDAALHPTPIGVAIQFRDLTGEDARRGRLELLEAAVDRIGDMIVITDAAEIDEPNGPTIVYVNQAFERVTGYSREEAIGRTPRILQGPDTATEPRARIRRALERVVPVHEELINYSKAGGRYWTELEIAPLLGATGAPTHFVAVQRDITERKRGLERIRESEERFRLISRATSDVIWDWNIRTGDFWLSENYEKVFGRDISGEPQTFDASIARIHPDDQDRVRRSLEQAVRGSDEFWSAEYRVLNAAGGYAIVEDKAFIIRDDAGKPIRMVAGMTDVTEIRSLDEQLRQSQKLEAIGQLTGGVAHDFNNLLTIVLGNIDMLEDAILDPAIRKRLDAVAQAAERGADLTRSLLAFARRQPLAPRPTDVDELLRNSEQILRQAASEAVGIDFHLNSAPSRAMIDPVQLQSAVLNLVLNATNTVRETPRPGRITIETRATALDTDRSVMSAEIVPGPYVLIAVSDNGTGMTQEQVGHAFEPFYTTRADGSGLGLSTVYGFLRQSGGHAHIYSEPDIGTTVRLYLPVTIERTRSGKPLGGTAGSPMGAGEHVLLVEDEASLRTSVGKLVESLGYRVTVASDAVGALQILAADDTIDLLFTDVVLAGVMNGKMLAETAHRLKPDLKVLFTSGYTQNVIDQNGQVGQDVRLLSKPYRRGDLAQALRDALDD